MPLIHGKSDKAFSQNVRTEMHHGKSQPQSLAIAYAVKKKAQHHKMAEGGACEPHGLDMCQECHPHYAHGGEAGVHIPKMSAGKHGGKSYAGDALEKEKKDEVLAEHDLVKAQMEHMKHKDRKYLAFGGDTGSYNTKNYVSDYTGQDDDAPTSLKNNSKPSSGSSENLGKTGASLAALMAEGGPVPSKAPKSPVIESLKEAFHYHADPPAAHAEEKKSDTNPLSESMKKSFKTPGYAMGGDIVDHIMKKHYSHGGVVANEDHDMADFHPNQFDDLVLDDHLEEHYTGKNSGDELGNEQEDHDRRDIVHSIMKSRKKKDRLPHPA